MQIDNAAIARQLGYTKEQMIAKFGQPGEKSPEEIGKLLGLDSATVNTVFGTPQNTTATSNSGSDTVDLIDDLNKSYAAIAKQLGYTKEQMIAKFGEPGEKSPEEIGKLLGLNDSTIRTIFGEDPSAESSSSSTSSSSDEVPESQKAKDDKCKEVADALGYDVLTVSAIMKAVEDGASGKPEEVVPALAKQLGLPQNVVSDVLKYLNNGQI